MGQGETFQGACEPKRVRTWDGIKWFCKVALGPEPAEAFLVIRILAGPDSSLRSAP